MWNIFLWAYATMNVNEFLTPFIAVNDDGFRKLRPNQGEGQRSMICSRVRSLLSNSLGTKKYRYVGYRNFPKERIVDGVYHICLEGLFEGQQRRNRLGPELLYLAIQMGLQLGPEYQKQYDRMVIKTINGSITDKKTWTGGRAPLGLRFAKDYYRSQNKLDPAKSTKQSFLSMSTPWTGRMRASRPPCYRRRRPGVFPMLHAQFCYMGFPYAA